MFFRVLDFALGWSRTWQELRGGAWMKHRTRWWTLHFESWKEADEFRAKLSDEQRDRWPVTSVIPKPPSWRARRLLVRDRFFPKVVERGVTCPARMMQLGPWEHKVGLDFWELRGDDVCCSFCGSLHLERFFELCMQANDQESDVLVEPGRPGKFYVHRDSVPNGSYGSIKFYAYHDERDRKERMDDYEHCVAPAVRASEVKRENMIALQHAHETGQIH